MVEQRKLSTKYLNLGNFTNARKKKVQKKIKVKLKINNQVLLL